MAHNFLIFILYWTTWSTESCRQLSAPPTFGGVFHDFSVRGKVRGRSNPSAESCENMFEKGTHCPRIASLTKNDFTKKNCARKLPWCGPLTFRGYVVRGKWGQLSEDQVVQYKTKWHIIYDRQKISAYIGNGMKSSRRKLFVSPPVYELINLFTVVHYGPFHVQCFHLESHFAAPKLYMPGSNRRRKISDLNFPSAPHFVFVEVVINCAPSPVTQRLHTTHLLYSITFLN